jgi:hypothetical protein
MSRIERRDTVKEIWVIEANLDSVNTFEYRVTTLERMLQTNVARIFSKVNDLSTKWKESNWIVAGMAYSEEEANQKAERLKSMVISEREHAFATGKSLYLNL